VQAREPGGGVGLIGRDEFQHDAVIPVFLKFPQVLRQVPHCFTPIHSDDHGVAVRRRPGGAARSVIPHPAFAVEPWALRETELDSEQIGIELRR